MKLRHAAALGLLLATGCAGIETLGSTGKWKLLLPPISVNGLVVHTQAPLSQWQNFGWYATEADCQAALSSIQQHASITSGVLSAQRDYQARYVRIAQAQCVALDDPRLTGDGK